jgi:hypothetical protein
VDVCEDFCAIKEVLFPCFFDSLMDAHHDVITINQIYSRHTALGGRVGRLPRNEIAHSNFFLGWARVWGEAKKRSWFDLKRIRLDLFLVQNIN